MPHPTAWGGSGKMERTSSATAPSRMTQFASASTQANRQDGAPFSPANGGTVQQPFCQNRPFSMPFSIAVAVHCELIIKKSRFLGCVQPVPDRPAAQEIVKRLRTEHPDANHVCWALLAGGQSAAVDDGEPGGTAGRPMLDVLRHHDLEGVLATAVRYFGGVMLGAGGLVRAYTDCVAQPLKEAVKTPIIHLTTLLCQTPYAFEGTVRRAITENGALLGDVHHGPALVELSVTLPADKAAIFAAQLGEASSGRVVCANKLT